MHEASTTNALQLLQAAADFRDRLSGELASVHGLSVQDFLLMLHLDRSTGRRLSRVDLAKRMHLSASTITRMARPLEKVGLLARGSHERDARLAFVVLTEAGQARYEEARATFAKQSEALFADRWSSEDLAELSGLLHRLVASAPW